MNLASEKLLSDIDDIDKIMENMLKKIDDLKKITKESKMKCSSEIKEEIFILSKY